VGTTDHHSLHQFYVRPTRCAPLELGLYEPHPSKEVTRYVGCSFRTTVHAGLGLQIVQRGNGSAIKTEVERIAVKDPRAVSLVRGMTKQAWSPECSAVSGGPIAPGLPRNNNKKTSLATFQRNFGLSGIQASGGPKGGASGPGDPGLELGGGRDRNRIQLMQQGS
jgi:hypothetical protein